MLPDPKNDSYFKVWAKKPNGGVGTAEKEPTKKDDIAEIIRAAREGNKLEPHVISWIQDFANHRDDLAGKLAAASAKNPTADLANLITAMKGIMPVPPATPSPAQQPDTLAIIKQIKDLQPDPLDILEQAQKIFAPAQPAQTDDIAQFEKFLGVADRLARWRGGTADRSGWDVGLDFARELGTPILNLISNALVLRHQANGAPRAAPGGAAAGGTPSVFDPYASPEILRQHARTLNSQPPATAFSGAASPPAPPGAPPFSTQQAPSATPPQGATASNELDVLLQSYGGLVLNSLNAGTPGYVLAEDVARLFGTATIAMIANHGEEPIRQSMLAIPELAVFGEGRLRRFAHEFTHYEEFLEQEDEEERSDEVGVGTKLENTFLCDQVLITEFMKVAA